MKTNNLKAPKLVKIIFFLFFIVSFNCFALKNKVIVNLDLIMKGTKFETKLYIVEGKEDGPTIWINGGTHGDEKAGYLTAEKMLSYDLKRGRLIILPRMNNLACKAEQRTTYFMKDLNRAFPGKKDGNSTEKLAYDIVKKIRKYNPQIIIDMHESRDHHKEGKLGNSIIFSKQSEVADLVMNLILDINEGLEDSNDGFTFFSNPPKGSLNFEIPHLLDIPVLTIETNRKLPLKLRIEQQLDIVQRILRYYQ